MLLWSFSSSIEDHIHVHIHIHVKKKDHSNYEQREVSTELQVPFIFFGYPILNYNDFWDEAEGNSYN